MFTTVFTIYNNTVFFVKARKANLEIFNFAIFY